MKFAHVQFLKQIVTAVKFCQGPEVTYSRQVSDLRAIILPAFAVHLGHFRKFRIRQSEI